MTDMMQYDDYSVKD